MSRLFVRLFRRDNSKISRKNVKNRKIYYSAQTFMNSFKTKQIYSLKFSEVLYVELDTYTHARTRARTQWNLQSWRENQLASAKMSRMCAFNYVRAAQQTKVSFITFGLESESEPEELVSIVLRFPIAFKSRPNFSPCVYSLMKILSLARAHKRARVLPNAYFTPPIRNSRRLGARLLFHRLYERGIFNAGKLVNDAFTRPQYFCVRLTLFSSKLFFFRAQQL